MFDWIFMTVNQAEPSEKTSFFTILIDHDQKSVSRF